LQVQRLRSLDAPQADREHARDARRTASRFAVYGLSRARGSWDIGVTDRRLIVVAAVLTVCAVAAGAYVVAVCDPDGWAE